MCHDDNLGGVSPRVAPQGPVAAVPLPAGLPLLLVSALGLLGLAARRGCGASGH